MGTPSERKRSWRELHAGSASPLALEHVNKRPYMESLQSERPAFTKLAIESDEDEVHMIPGSVFQSPVLLSRLAASARNENSPTRAIRDPFTQLSLKASPSRGHMITPITARHLDENPKSVKKSARKMPGSVKSNKPSPFRVKACLPL